MREKLNATNLPILSWQESINYEIDKIKLESKITPKTAHLLFKSDSYYPSPLGLATGGLLTYWALYFYAFKQYHH